MFNFSSIYESFSSIIETIIGAVVGGYVAFLIAKYQIVKNDNLRRSENAINESNGEIRLLWEIFFDIKKDIENSGLWQKYDKLIQVEKNSVLVKSVADMLQFLMRDIRNFFILLESKESEYSEVSKNDLDLLWERGGQVLIFMFKILTSLENKGLIIDVQTINYYKNAGDLQLKHAAKVKNTVKKYKTK